MARRNLKRGSNSARKEYSVDSLADAISNELKGYSEEITIAMKEITWDVTDRLVGRTKADAPTGRRKGKYKRAISSKTLFESEHKLIEVWYVKKPHYRLAHLLNNGHKTRSKGYVKGDNHITKNEEIAVKEFETMMEDAIKNGN